MKIKTTLFASIATILMIACNKDKTIYEFQFSFDNTNMNASSVRVYELREDSLTNGKWRSDHLNYDTIIRNGDTLEWAHAYIKSPARSDCRFLFVCTEGYRSSGGGNWDLDTIFELKPGINNVFTIDSSFEHLWKNHYASK